jgi:hypothetical protein
MNRAVLLMATGGALVALAAFFMTQVRSAGPTETAETPQAPQAKATGRPDDEAAIRKATADFVKDLDKGNAKVKKLRVEVTIESIRFPSKDTAIEEGYAKAYKGNSEHPTSSRYSVLHVREGGRWLMAVLREWPEEGTSIHDLEWLIGTWEAKAEGADVRTAYTWDDKKNSIRCQITIKGPDRTIAAMQVLLKDPRNGQLRSWIFDDEGGFGDASWTRDGKRWLIAAAGVQGDGGELTALNILAPIDRDNFTWQSTQRTLDGEELPNIAPIKVTRVK